MVKKEDSNTVAEVRKEKMVSPNGGNPTTRTARFLKPNVSCTKDAASIPTLPLLSEIISHGLVEWPSKVLFRGKTANLQTQKKWKQWVDKLAQKHRPIWEKAGIFDAIICSTYHLRIDQVLILGLLELWCTETNTFVFPWGESTMTLEDVLILGGFSVLGEAVTTALNEEELVKIEKEMKKQRTLLGRNKSKKATYSDWMNKFMESDSDLEHVAFLSSWLSRYVFPSRPDDTVNNNVFSVAILLSRGTKIALAPAVLASLYRDLRLLKEQVLTSSSTYPTVWAPFRIMQMWAWERFPALRPNSPNQICASEPRAARWHKKSSNTRLPLVRSALASKLLESFQWRPYATSVNNWCCPSFYRDRDLFVFDGSVLDYELRSFICCLRPCELVGLDCIEQYLPHRVGMQFGMDQDLPGHYNRANLNWEFAWRTYEKPTENVSFYVPHRLFVAGVTLRYSEWWKQSMLVRSEAVQSVLVQQGSREKLKKKSSQALPEEIRNSVTSPLNSKINRQILIDSSDDDDDDKLPISVSLKLRRQGTGVANRGTREKAASSTPSLTSVSSTTGNRMVRKRKLSSTPTEHVVHSEGSVGVKEIKAGDSAFKPIKVDEHERSSETSGCLEQELEARVLQLEKLMGLKPK